MPFQSVGAELKRFAAGTLHSGKGGPVVRSRKQAEAIAIAEKERAKGQDPAHHMKMATHHALGLANHLSKLRKLGALSSDD
jgi:hypothetical protein